MVSRSVLALLGAVVSMGIAGCSGGDPASPDSRKPVDTGTADTATAAGPTEADTGEVGPDSLYSAGTEDLVIPSKIDDDSDGFTEEQGDCLDSEPYVNPVAVEDVGVDADSDGVPDGDGLDNDCDGEVDEVEVCDTDAGVDLGVTASALAKAMGLCDDRYFLEAEKLHSNKINFDQAYATPYQLGPARLDTDPSDGVVDCFFPRQGRFFAALATGPVRQLNANDATSLDPEPVPVPSPRPAFSGDAALPPTSDLVCDWTALRLTLRAPVNAVGFSFDFLFASAEYSEWLNQDWNDAFYAILEHPDVNGGQPTNIAFDSNGNEIEVDANFFENDVYQCSERGTGWDPNNVADGDTPGSTSGSTGWLRTQWPVAGGDTFSLTFSIHDGGAPSAGGAACGWDSLVVIDNFRWILKGVEFQPGTQILLE